MSACSRSQISAAVIGVFALPGLLGWLLVVVIVATGKGIDWALDNWLPEYRG